MDGSSGEKAGRQQARGGGQCGKGRKPSEQEGAFSCADRSRKVAAHVCPGVGAGAGPEGAGGEDTAVWAVDRKCCGLRPPLGFGDVGLSQKVSCRSCRGIETWD